MKAEEVLQEWYKACQLKDTFIVIEAKKIPVSTISGILIAPEHIDLIASLVVERLRGKNAPNRQ